MALHKTKIRIVAADPTKGDLIVHFSDGTSVLYHARFLDEVRNDDGNVALPDTAEEESSLEE